MVIDVTAAKEDYVKMARANLDKMVRKYSAVPDKIARATSETAQAAYIAGVTDPVAQKLRIVNLRKWTDSALNDRMERKGRVAYPAGVDAGKEDWAKEFDPYAKELDRIVPALQTRTRDAATNVTNRVTPIAVGLANKKRALVGA